MLEPGAPAPTFSLPGAHDGEIDEFALPSDPDRVHVLVFYPMDFSPACTREMCALRDVELFGLTDDVRLLGISGDSAYSHRAFADANGLGYPLLSDRLGETANAYEVLADEVEGHPRVPKRAIFVLDLDRTVQYAWSTDDPGVQPDLDDVVDAIEAIQDDRTATDRYRDALEQFKYGRSELDAARDAYDEAHWGLAIETFQEARYYLEAAADGFRSAQRFAESEATGAAAGSAAETAVRLRQAAEWFASAARAHGDGNRDAAAEYYEDAVDAIEDVGDLPRLESDRT
jgi:peroxiredoxin